MLAVFEEIGEVVVVSSRVIHVHLRNSDPKMQRSESAAAASMARPQPVLEALRGAVSTKWYAIE